MSRADAIANCNHTALLVYALQQQRYDLLATAMDDRLHQPYRAALIPGMFEAITAGYAAGALGVALSGAGPSLLAITQGQTTPVATALQRTFANHGVTCSTLELAADAAGAVCTTL